MTGGVFATLNLKTSQYVLLKKFQDSLSKNVVVSDTVSTFLMIKLIRASTHNIHLIYIRFPMPLNSINCISIFI